MVIIFYVSHNWFGCIYMGEEILDTWLETKWHWMRRTQPMLYGTNYMHYAMMKELWDNINHMYSNLGNQSHVYEITLKLDEIWQREDNVTEYFNSLKCLWQDLVLFSDYEWKLPDDCNHNKNMVGNHQIFKFVAGLNIEFDEVRGRIIGRQRLPSLEEVFSKLRREESRRSVMLEKKIGNL